MERIPLYGDPTARRLARLGVESALLWNDAPPSGESRIILGSSFSVIGKHTSLPEALKRVLARTDNQDETASGDDRWSGRGENFGESLHSLLSSAIPASRCSRIPARAPDRWALAVLTQLGCACDRARMATAGNWCTT